MPPARLRRKENKSATWTTTPIISIRPPKRHHKAASNEVSEHQLKPQAPSVQAPEKLQAPNPDLWNLEFGTWIFSEAWCLGAWSFFNIASTVDTIPLRISVPFLCPQ